MAKSPARVAQPHAALRIGHHRDRGFVRKRGQVAVQRPRAVLEPEDALAAGRSTTCAPVRSRISAWQSTDVVSVRRGLLHQPLAVEAPHLAAPANHIVPSWIEMRAGDVGNRYTFDDLVAGEMQQARLVAVELRGPHRCHLRPARRRTMLPPLTTMRTLVGVKRLMPSSVPTQTLPSRSSNSAVTASTVSPSAAVNRSMRGASAGNCCAGECARIRQSPHAVARWIPEAALAIEQHRPAPVAVGYRPRRPLPGFGNPLIGRTPCRSSAIQVLPSRSRARNAADPPVWVSGARAPRGLR